MKSYLLYYKRLCLIENWIRSDLFEVIGNNSLERREFKSVKFLMFLVYLDKIIYLNMYFCDLLLDYIEINMVYREIEG